MCTIWTSILKERNPNVRIKLAEPSFYLNFVPSESMSHRGVYIWYETCKKFDKLRAGELNLNLNVVKKMRACKA